MTNTLELLDTIGSDASLRYAPADELARTLARMQASTALLDAVTQGRRNPLFSEFGNKPLRAPQANQSPGREDEEPAEEELPASRHLGAAPRH